MPTKQSPRAALVDAVYEYNKDKPSFCWLPSVTKSEWLYRLWEELQHKTTSTLPLPPVKQAMAQQQLFE